VNRNLTILYYDTKLDMLYKYVGIGLLALFALIAIPVTTNAETDDPRMYGMAFLSLKDSTGNVLFENTIHNEVLNRGTRYMFDITLEQQFPINFNEELVNSICVTNDPSFVVNENENPFSFNSPDTLTLSRCIANFDFTITSNAADSGSQFFEAGIHIDAGSTITGIGVCQVPFNALPNTALDCDTAESSVMFAEIDTPDTLVNANEELEVRYILNLD